MSLNLLPQINEHRSNSPSRSQLSDIVRSIETSDVLSSTSSTSSTSRQLIENTGQIDDIKMAKDVENNDTGDSCSYKGRQVAYHPDKINGNNKLIDDNNTNKSPNNIKKTSAATIFPLSTGLLAVKEAFGESIFSYFSSIPHFFFFQNYQIYTNKIKSRFF